MNFKILIVEDDPTIQTQLKNLLTANGWTWITAVSMMLFSLMHWPCSTTMMTIKKETGKSFIGYLTDYRMDQAARRLLETNEKSYMIAKSVGYADPNYFSYVFKRRFGVSPSKYRTEYGEREK